jgi:hypothetical protein
MPRKCRRHGRLIGSRCTAMPVPSILAADALGYARRRGWHPSRIEELQEQINERLMRMTGP